MRRTLLAKKNVYLRLVAATDQTEFIKIMRASKLLHARWVTAPTTSTAFAKYLQRCASKDFCGLLVCEKSSDAIVGVINISQIFYGALQSAYLGYYAAAHYAERGYMTAGLQLALRYAFNTLKLHRLEANIQPDNFISIALVKRCGFRLEGYSARYLKIAGRWRDHERWAITKSS